MECLKCRKDSERFRKLSEDFGTVSEKFGTVSEITFLVDSFFLEDLPDQPISDTFDGVLNAITVLIR
jgi:hypothetical protein